MTTLIGLAGYARSGKDTLATHLVERHGFTRLAFADALRASLYALDPWVLVAPVEDEHGTDDEPRRLQDVVDCIGWDEAKVIYPEVRRLLQRLGTEAGRDIHGRLLWVSAVMSKVEPGGRYVISDVRFPDEVEAIEERDGSVYRVERRGTIPVNGHHSETALDHLRLAPVYNNGTIEALARQADYIAWEVSDE